MRAKIKDDMPSFFKNKKTKNMSSPTTEKESLRDVELGVKLFYETLVNL